MSESQYTSSIGANIGLLGMIGAGGIAAKELYRTYQDIKGRKDRMGSSHKSWIDTPLVPDESLATQMSNIADVGFADAVIDGQYLKVTDVKKLNQLIYGEAGNKSFQNVIEYTQSLTNNEFHFGVKIYENGAKEIVMHTGKKKHGISLGFVSDNGAIRIASTNAGHQYYVPQFFLPEDATRAILNNEVSGDITSFVRSNAMDFNTYKLYKVNEILSSPMKTYQKKKEIKKLNMDINKYVLHEPDMTPSGYITKAHMNTVIPNGLKNSRERKRYVENFNRNFETYGGKTSPTFLKSVDAVASARLNIPDLDLGIAKEISVAEGNHALHQMLNKSARIEGAAPNRFALDLLNNTNAIPVPTLRLSANDAIFDALTDSGYDVGGVAMPHLGKEDVWINKSLASKTVLSNHPITLKLEDAIMPKKTVSFFDDLFDFYYEKMGNKSHASLAANATRGQKLKYMIRQGNMPEILQQYSDARGFKNGIALKDMFDNGTILETTTGKVRVGRGRVLLNDISLTNEGIRLDTTFRSKVGMVGKNWGTVKSIYSMRLRQEHMRRLVTARMVLEDVIQSGDINAESAIKLINTTSSKNKVAAARATEMLDNMISKHKTVRPEFHKELNTMLDSDFRVLKEGIRKGGDSFNRIRSLTNAETLASAEKNPALAPYMRLLSEDEQKTGGMASINTDIYTTDKSPILMGIDPSNKVQVNSILENTLSVSKQNAAADFVRSHFNYNKKVMHELYNEFMPVLNKPIEGRHIKLNWADISGTETIEELTSTSTKVARNRAMQIAQGMTEWKNKPIPDNAAFYTTINGNNVPLSTTESHWTNIVSNKGFASQDEPIRKLLSKTTRDYLMAASKGWDGQQELYNDLKQSWVNVLGQHVNLTSAMSDATMKVYRGRGVFDKGLLETLIAKEGSPGAVQKTLSRYGLTIDSVVNKDLAGYSSKNFTQILEQTELYEQLKKGGLQGAELRETAMRKGIPQVVTRHPAYGTEGVTVARAIDEEALMKDLMMTSGGVYDENVRSIVHGAIDDLTVHVSDPVQSKAMLDKDFDPVLGLTPKSEALRAKMIEESDSVAVPLIRQTYLNKKSTVKGMSKNISSYIESAFTESGNIAKGYNETYPYSMRFNSKLAEAFDNTGIGVWEKARAFDHMAVSTPEMFIGGKLFTNEVDAADYLSVFDSASGKLENRAEKFMQYTAKMNEHLPGERGALDVEFNGKLGNIFNDFTTIDDVKNWLKSGDKVKIDYADYLKYATKQVHNVDQVNRIHGRMNDIGSIPISNAQVNALHDITPVDNSFRRTSNTLGDVIAETAPRVLKNRTFQLIAGGALAAGYLLRPRDNAMQQQEVREESQKQIPQGAEAIDPPTGAVYQPRGTGFKHSIRGTVPVSSNAQTIRMQLGKMGFINQNTFINRNQSADEEHINNLNKEEKYNSWSR